MTIAAQLFALLNGATDAADRVYPVIAKPDVSAPYITFQVVAGVPDTGLGGASGLVNTRMQIDCYAGSHSEVDALKAQVEAALAGSALQNVELSTQDLYEADVNLFRVLLDYSIWHT